MTTQQFTAIPLSGGTANGRPIKVVATSSPGTTIHTVVVGYTDEVWLWANNTNAGSVTLTVEFGGTSNPDDRIANAYVIPANSALVLIVPGIRLDENLVVKAFASSANVLLISGNANRIEVVS